MRDKSKLEIDTKDIQNYYNGKTVNIADIEAFVTGQVSDKQPGKNIVNNQGFYISQSDYIEYQIAKRQVIKKHLKRKKLGNNLWLAFVWLLKTLISILLTCLICYGFYMLVWGLQQTFK